MGDFIAQLSKPKTRDKGDIEVIYQDEWVVVINKPAGLDSVRGMYSIDCVLDYLEQKLKDNLAEPLRVVHRLDRDASGVMVLAKDKDAQRNLTKQWNENTVKKTYLAIVQGYVAPEEDRIELPLSKTDKSSTPMVVDIKRGKTAITEYRVLRQYRNYALLEVNIHTGRMHQIRVHLSSRGFPILCDPHYGDRGPLYLSKIKRRYKRSGRKEVEKPLIDRLALHSYRLTFKHPVNDEELTFIANVPKDFYTTIRQLEKYSR